MPAKARRTRQAGTIEARAPGRLSVHVRAHPWVEHANLEPTRRIIRYRLHNGLRINRYRHGDPERRYVVLDSMTGPSEEVGHRRTFKAAMQLALEHRMYAQPLVVPQRQGLLATREATVFAGMNSSQYFWQSADGKIALIRNRQETHWWAMENGTLVEDQEALERLQALRPNLCGVLLSHEAPEGLANRLARLGLQVRFDRSRAWRDGALRPTGPATPSKSGK